MKRVGYHVSEGRRYGRSREAEALDMGGRPRIVGRENQGEKKIKLKSCSLLPVGRRRVLNNDNGNSMLNKGIILYVGKELYTLCCLIFCELQEA